MLGAEYFIIHTERKYNQKKGHTMTFKYSRPYKKQVEMTFSEIIILKRKKSERVLPSKLLAQAKDVAQ